MKAAPIPAARPSAPPSDPTREVFCVQCERYTHNGHCACNPRETVTLHINPARLREHILSEPDHPCPDCGKEMALAKPDTGLYLCGNIDCPPVRPGRSGDGDPPPPDFDELLARHRTAWIGYASAATDGTWGEEWERRGNAAADAIRAALASQRAARARVEQERNEARGQLAATHVAVDITAVLVSNLFPHLKTADATRLREAWNRVYAALRSTPTAGQPEAVSP